MNKDQIEQISSILKQILPEIPTGKINNQWQILSVIMFLTACMIGFLFGYLSHYR